ncbi:conserved oligomeric Golgi complex subunit 3 [Pycnococcus provasolii]
MAPKSAKKASAARSNAPATPSANAGANTASSTAARGYSVATAWEARAGVSDAQEAALQDLAAIVSASTEQANSATTTATRSEPPSDALASTSASNAAAASTSSQQLLDTQSPLTQTSAFYKWHSEVEAARSQETEGKYRQYADTLQHHLDTCDGILGTIANTMSALEALQYQHQAVRGKTSGLHDQTESLAAERQQLVAFADALRAKLNYFDELEKVGTLLQAATLSSAKAPTGGDFLPLLQRLDDSVAYIAAHPQFAEAAAYGAKFRHLQSRALGSIRSHFASEVKRAAAASEKACVDALGQATFDAGQIDEAQATSHLYVRFRAAVPELHSLMAEIESRSGSPEYQKLLSDLHAIFCEQRLILMQRIVERRFADFARSSTLMDLARAGCGYLSQLNKQEHALFEHFFPHSAASPWAMAPLLEPLCQVLYDSMRPGYVATNDMDVLCELAHILKHEVLEEQLSHRVSASAGMRPLIMRVLADVQERLTFRAQAFMREEVAAFVPSEADLDYPAKLERAAAEEASKANGGSNGDAADTVAPDGSDGAARMATDTGSRAGFATWYPPLERTLVCLSKIYHCLDTNVFGSLAHEGVGLCARSIDAASRTVAKNGTPLDGLLFAVKHLLILREQIQPFNVNFRVIDKELDFSHMRDQLRRITSGELSLFELSSMNAVMQLVTRSAPRVLESSVDSKKELEVQLKNACEAFIMSVTKLTVEPLLSFITKVTAVRVAAAAAAGGQEKRGIREQAFAAPERLAEMANKVNEALEVQLPTAVQKMKLYLGNPGTRAILFKPIKSNVAEAHAQIAALLDAEYSAEDRASITLKSPAELGDLLEALS